ncbi:MAG: MFS transporter, partial [Cellvibrionaceae bacterium]|nr:MFS transporter [Cellvibrionaceae bacterium]
MIAPTIGGFLDDQISWRAGFAFSGLFALIILIWAWYTLPETNRYLGKATSIAKMLGDYRTLSGYRAFWLFTMVCAFTGGIFFTFLGGAPYVSHQIFGMGPTEYGLFFALVAIGYSIGNYLSGRYTGRFGLFRMMLGGNLVSLLACLFVIALSTLGIEHPLVLFGAVGFVGVGNGMTLPSANVGIVSVLPELAGTASGYSGFLVTLVCAFFSYVVAFILSDSVMPMA